VGHGSAQLVQTLVEHNLVDGLRLMVFPVLVGAGKQLELFTVALSRGNASPGRVDPWRRSLALGLVARQS
jgi:hypothetical protein